MRYETLLKQTKGLPVIETEILLAGVANPQAVRVQLSRWVKLGKIVQLKRGVYLLPETFRREDVPVFYIASVLQKPSYISLEKALEYYDLIPESVPVFTSVTTKRQGKFTTEAGVFDYRHVRKDLFWGYRPMTQTGKPFLWRNPKKPFWIYFI